MKWFKHETDASGNLKLESVIDKFGLEGYGYYWICVELVGKEGTNYKIEAYKDWKAKFKRVSGISFDRQDKILNFFAEKILIDKDALTNGDLYIPKMEERSDDYTNKVRRKSVQDTDNVSLEENRIEEIRIEENTYGEFGKVKLTSEEYSKLTERLTEKNTLILIRELDEYIAAKGKKYSSHYAVIQTWARRRISEHQEKKSLKGKTFIT